MPPVPQLDLVTVAHLNVTWISWLWFPYGALLDLVPVVSIWTHLENNDSDPYLGLSWICCLWSLTGLIGTWILTYIPGPHLDLVTVVPPGPHLDEVTGSHRDLTWTW